MDIGQAQPSSPGLRQFWLLFEISYDLVCSDIISPRFVVHCYNSYVGYCFLLPVLAIAFVIRLWLV